MLCRYELFEEAFEIYKKFGLKQQAIRVVLEHMEDLDRAHEYATKVPSWWLCCIAVPLRCVTFQLGSLMSFPSSCRWMSLLYGASWPTRTWIMHRYGASTRKKVDYGSD